MLAVRSRVGGNVRAFGADLTTMVHMRALLHILAKAAAFVVQVLVRFYQVAISPLLIGHCKFHPSCSEYFAQAVREWGVLRGGWLGIKRVARCAPFGMGGLDPVPKREGQQRQPTSTVNGT